MGYCIEMTDSKFNIKKENFREALEALKSVFVPENMSVADYVGGKVYPHFSWVDTDVVLNSHTLGEALEEIRYAPEYDEDGNICGIEFNGEKYGDEKIFFVALAPYVESGSYIAFEGEDGFEWHWVFYDGEVKKVDVSED